MNAYNLSLNIVEITGIGLAGHIVRREVSVVDAVRFYRFTVNPGVCGTYSGHAPGQYMHGRISVGAEQCQYQALSINDTVLSLQWCSGGLGPNTYLAAGSVIELGNFNAPGFLLEANFVLVK